MTSFFWGGEDSQGRGGLRVPTRVQRLQLDVAGRWHEVMARDFFPPISTPKHPSLFISQELGEQQTVG